MPKKKPTNAERNKSAKERAAKMKALSDDGVSYDDIGKKFGNLSRQRVHQILNKYYPQTA